MRSSSAEDPDFAGEATPVTAPRAAGARLSAAVYDELRSLASAHLRRERAGGTLDTTAVVHEAWLRVQDQRTLDPGNREQFLGLAAQAIRRILVDHARRRRARKRGGDRVRVAMGDGAAAGAAPGTDVLALDEALDRLRSLHERQARVVELRFFGGLDVPETARVLGISARSVEGDWAVARAWLRRELSRGCAG